MSWRLPIDDSRDSGDSVAVCPRYITRNVIERAGLRDTELPTEPYVDGPHSQIYEAWFGMIDPPRATTASTTCHGWGRRPR